MVAWRYEISLPVLKKYFTRSLRSLVKYFLTLKEKFRISASHVISSIYPGGNHSHVTPKSPRPWLPWKQ